MSEDEKIIKSNNQQNLKSKNTKDALDDIYLSENLKDDLLKEALGESVLNTIPVIKNISGFLQSFNSKLDNARIQILLNEFSNKHDSAEIFQSQIKKLITTPSGIILFQKIIRIINADIVDTDFIKLLATVLKRVSDSDFNNLFNEHNYILSQIEKLSPQALFLLHDKSNWPRFSFSSTTISNQTLGEGWAPKFAQNYLNEKGITNDTEKAYVIHATQELTNNSLTKVEHDRLTLTGAGENIYKYLR